MTTIAVRTGNLEVRRDNPSRAPRWDPSWSSTPPR